MAKTEVKKDNIENKKDETFDEKVSSMGALLQGIRSDYENTISKIKNSDYTSLLERIVSAEKDLKAVTDKLIELKSNVENNTESLSKVIVQYQEVSGSINQIKLIIDEFKEYHKTEKENKLNFVFQIVVPIILAMIFFLSGLFFKSCSSIHEQNIKQNPNNRNNTYEYRNFESNKNK